MFLPHPLSKPYICFVHRIFFLLLWTLWSCFPIFPHIYCAKQTMNGSQITELLTPQVWSAFVAWQSLFDPKLWNFSECKGCPILFQPSSRDLHDFQHELSHLAGKKHEHPQIRAGKGCHMHSKNTAHAILRTKGKTTGAQLTLHKAGVLTRLRWLHPPLAEGNNYRCGLNLDLVVFSSQWNMGPSLKYKRKDENKKNT